MDGKSVVYVGKDLNFYNALKESFSRKDINLLNFFEDRLSIAGLSRNNCRALIMECEYKSSLAIIEAIRTSVEKYNSPYILLIGDISQLKEIKKQFTTRNYPDDISLKNINPLCVVNHIEFVLKNIEEINEEIRISKKDVIKGDLNTKPYGSLLYELYEDSFTGKVILDSLIDKAVISFVNGQPVNVKFNKIQFTLGRILLKKGLLSEDDYLKSLDIMVKDGKRHGEALISLNILKPSDIAEAIKDQFYEKLYYFFSKGQGDFLVVRSDFDDISFTNPQVDIFNLIYNGIKTYTPNNYLIEKYVNYREKFIAITENYTLLLDKIPFDDLEKGIVNFLAEPKKFLEAITRYSKDFEHLFKSIEILISFKMIAFCDDEETAKNISSWANPKMIEIKEEIMRDYLNFKEKNYYEILGVNQDAENGEIKKRYIELAKKYHPDRYNHYHLPKDLLQKIKENFQIIQTAYEILSDKDKRESYDATIQSPILKEMMEKTENIINAEIAFKKGEILLKRRNYREARNYFKEAVNLNNREPEYLVNLAITNIFLKDSHHDEHTKEARSSLERAVYINPYCEKAYYYLGILNKLENRKDEAILCFKKTLNINPDNKEAYLELKGLEKV
ncbi:MAG: DnaJ domain-containing protein [Proteobacteria bacterium]|nr:DnaJ domain-containing protein [Pseudomonadota bacterium]